MKLDLTRKRYTILSDARVLVENNDNVDFVYSDINCRLKVRFKNKSEFFFSDIKNLEDLVN